MPALYRQYRPTTFAEIIGQGHITSILTQEITQNALAHAYLFQGPRGTGKTTTARVFSKRLNCKDATEQEACGKCVSCTAFQENRALDVIEIDAASNRGIDDIRALRETANLSATLGKYKIYIIDEVHQLSTPAFAALLKILEEPPSHVIFILATTELQKVPATIASRCQLFRFRRATTEEMRGRILHLLSQEKREADNDLISFIISRSDGCYRDAESLLGQLLSQGEGTLTVIAASGLLGIPDPELIKNFLAALVASDTKEAITLATKAYADGFDPEQFLQEAIRQTRDAVIATITNTNPPAFAVGPNATERLTAIMRAFLVATQDLVYVPEPMIALELAILTATAGRKTQSETTLTPPNLPLKRGGENTKQQNPPPFQGGVGGGAKTIIPEQSKNLDSRLTKIRSSWEAIIQQVRTTNPVASTFLRATSPSALTENTLTLYMNFPLHKSFFDKPESKKIVTEAIKIITEEEVIVMCQLNAIGQSTQLPEQRESQEADLLKNVQEVFGVQVR